jgi:hypothetical protein
MLQKELYLAIAAYNLVRAVICLAAERIQVSPRRLSFTNVFTLLETFLPDLSAATTPAAWNTCWDRIIQLATSYVLPNRTKPRSYPRYVWRKSSGFPFYKAPKLKLVALRRSARATGVFITFGGPAGPWKLPHGRGSVTPWGGVYCGLEGPSI